MSSHYARDRIRKSNDVVGRLKSIYSIERIFKYNNLLFIPL